jgi:FkbM family methyltransferase
MKQFLKANNVALVGGLLSLPSYCTKVKLDVGLSVSAPQSAIWLNREPNLFVYGFEPVERNREAILSGNHHWPIKLNPALIGQRILIIPCALGRDSIPEGQRMFITKTDPGCSSLLEPIGMEIDYMEEVPVFSLGDFLSHFPFQRIKQIDHLKIDVQGSDFEVLRGAGEFLKKIMAITIEVDTSNYVGTRNSSLGIKVYLLKRGFLRIRNRTLWIFISRLFGKALTVETDDPTYLNLRFLLIRTTHSISLFQRG